METMTTSFGNLFFYGTLVLVVDSTFAPHPKESIAAYNSTGKAIAQ